MNPVVDTIVTWPALRGIRACAPSRRLGLGSLLLLALLGGCQLVIAPSVGGQARPNVTATKPCAAPGGAYCGQFGIATTLEVVPTAQAGYEFTGWSGDCTGMGVCQLTLLGNQTVQAEFTPSAALALNDTTSDLDLLLERGKLEGACERYHRAPDSASPYLTKLCGKWMFFYEGFALQGVPRPLVTFLAKNLPDTVGKGFEKYGMIPDPTSADHLPLGLAPGAKVNGVETLAYTCASCHLAKTPDGRFSVGMANHDYEYGKQLMALVFTPLAAALPSQTELDPLVKALVQPHLDEIKARGAQLSLYGSLLKLTPLLLGGNSLPTIDPAVQRQYMGWKPGTQDFLIVPVGTDDKVHTVSKILPLWNLYTEAEMAASGGHGALLGYTGSTPSLDSFLQGFVALSSGDKALYTPERLAPLRSYLLSLKAPRPLQAPDPQWVARGQRVFNERSCASCHNGPSHSSTRVFPFEEIATDSALKRWADPDLTGHTNVPQVVTYPLTHGIKAPRLVGLWAQKRFLHNGSVDSLSDLLCETKARPTRTDAPYGDQGHMMGCGLGAEDTKALLAYLMSL